MRPKASKALIPLGLHCVMKPQRIAFDGYLAVAL